METLNSLAGEFSVRVREVCRRRGWPVYGAAPDLLVDGVVLVSLYADRGAVRVNRRRYPLAAWERVERAIERSHERLVADGDPARLATELWEAYGKVLAAGGLPPGARVPVKAILEAAGLRREELRARLHRLLSASAAPVVEGRRLALESGSFAREGIYMYLVPLGRCAYVGRLLFREAEAAGA